MSSPPPMVSILSESQIGRMLNFNREADQHLCFCYIDSVRNFGFSNERYAL